MRVSHCCFIGNESTCEQCLVLLLLSENHFLAGVLGRDVFCHRTPESASGDLHGIAFKLVTFKLVLNKKGERRYWI